MLGFARFFLFGVAFLTVIYWLLSLYLRSLTRERLEEEWASDGEKGDRDTYVEDGLRDYATSFRAKLLLLVYILPMIAFCVVFYLTNMT